MGRYDPERDIWEKVADMSVGREGLGVATLGDELYAVGGETCRSEGVSSVEKYNVNADRWEAVAPMSTVRINLAVGVLHGKLYALGGKKQKSVERYDVKEKMWEP